MNKPGLVALAGLLLLGCSQSSPQSNVPSDGVHISGAVTGLYPIADGGTCAVANLPAGRQFVFSPNPGPQDATVGAVITDYTGPGVYSNVDLYVIVGGRTWSTNAGSITIQSADAAQAAGTIAAKHIQQVDRLSTVDVAGSWTCRMVAVPGSSGTPTTSPSPEVPRPAATPEGTPVEKQVLPPATDFPVANLCSTPLHYTADGNATPLFCRGGEVNVLAWKFYANVSPSILGLGLNPTAGQVQAALCDDFNRSHATKVAEESGYAMATAYYGWAFNLKPDPATCR
ncbi:MAG TPA: hypothetical protein VJR46_03350 [Candidatus Dormibacteraeota bacterium]|nr:hypothetical protein [Candidatus Dormibacteraeota bacterium]